VCISFKLICFDMEEIVYWMSSTLGKLEFWDFFGFYTI
jgi:hypothetical protein